MSNSKHAQRLSEVLEVVRGLADDAFDADDAKAADRYAGCRQRLTEAVSKLEHAALGYLPYDAWVTIGTRNRQALIEAAKQVLPPRLADRLAKDLPKVDAKSMSTNAKKLERELTHSRKMFNASVEGNDVAGVCRQAGLLARIEKSLEKELTTSGFNLTGGQLHDLANNFTSRIGMVARPIIKSDDLWAAVYEEYARRTAEQSEPIGGGDDADA